MTPRPFLAPGDTPPAQPPRFPSKPPPGRPPRRRGLLGALAALAAAYAVPVMAQPAAPDAELLALCSRHSALWASIHAMDAGAPHTDDDMDRAADERAELGERIAALRPATIAGLVAKARATQETVSGYHVGEWRNSPERMTDALLADLIAMEALA